MRKINLLKFTILFFAFQNMFGQASGNINYSQKQQNFCNYTYTSDHNINLEFQKNSDIILSVKALANVKADAYVAIFNVTQVGKDIVEVNDLINARIKMVENAVQNEENATFFVDMLSFVPIYEYEVEKKIFSKKTYNEIPKGFEVKKNLHIQFNEATYLDSLVAMCAKAEIYDLVKVDYVSEVLGHKKQELKTQALTMLKEKQKSYEDLLGSSFRDFEKDLVDAFKVVYPVEMYQSYQAFSRSSLHPKKYANVQVADKSNSTFYQSVMDKDFDLVIEPLIIEPVIQLMYEVKMKIKRPKKVNLPRTQKEYLMISSEGEIKHLDIK
ncbi:MAG: hypothetical protein ACPG5B_07065 [Chitinophagales bacterium]